MRRRTTRANNSFLLGSLVMIVLVLVVVVLFLFLSFRIYDKKDHASYAERYDIVFDKSALDTPLTIYINDSLLFSGTPRPELTLSVGRFAKESSLLVVDDATKGVSTIALSDRSETVRIAKKENGGYKKLVE